MLCIRLGFEPSGRSTVLDLAARDQPQYLAAIIDANDAHDQTGVQDTRRLHALLEGWLGEQLGGRN